MQSSAESSKVLEEMVLASCFSGTQNWLVPVAPTPGVLSFLQYLVDEGLAMARWSGADRSFRLTSKGVSSLLIQKPMLPMQKVFAVRDDIPLADRSVYEMLCMLCQQRFGWKAPMSKGSLVLGLM